MNRLRWLLVAIASVFVCLGLGAAGALTYLNSEAGSDRILAWIKSYLKDNMNTRLEYAEGRIYILSGLRFKQLKVSRDDEAVKSEIGIENLDLKYSFSLWQRSLEIEAFHIANAKIQARAKLQSENEATPSATPSSEESVPQKLERFISDPPVRVRIRDLAFKDISLDIDVQDQGSRYQAQIQGLNLLMSLEMLKERFLSKGEVSMASETWLASDTKVQDVVSRARARLAASGAWSVDVHHDGNAWIYQVEPTKVSLLLKDVHLAQMQGQDLTETDLPRLNIDTGIKALVRSSQLLDLDRNSIETMDITSKVNANGLTIDSKQSGKTTQIKIDSQDVSLSSQLAQDINIELKSQSNGVKANEYLSQPSTLVFIAKAKVPRDLDSAEGDATLNISGRELVRWTGSLEDLQSDKPTRISGQLLATLDRQSTKLIKPLENFKEGLEASVDFSGQRAQDGQVDLTSQLDIPKLQVTQIPMSSKLKMESQAKWNPAEEELGFSGTVDFTNPEYGAWILKSVSLVNLKRGIFEITTQIPSANIPDLARLGNTHLKLRATSPDLKAARKIKVEAEINQPQITLAEKIKKGAAENLPPITSFSGKLRADIENNNTFSIDELKFEANGSAILFEADGTGELDAKNLQAKAKLRVRFKDDFPLIAGQKIRGQMDAPIDVTVLRGRDISLSGELIAQNVSWSKEDLAASGINGKIPFSEKLKWDGEHVRFTSLINQNPFERVDFERVRPLLQNSDQLKINKLSWQEKTFGPLLGFFSIRQNMLFAHQFDMDLGSGRVYGEMFIDAYPSSLQFGSLSRMTGLNLNEILPAKFLARVPPGDKRISGRSGFVVNLNRSTMDGRIDITEIGAGQLIALTNVLDPAYEDEKMNQLRSVLQLGYPTSVGLAFAEGYLNMDVNLVVLGLANRQSLRGIPISSLLSKATADIVKQSEKGPLK